MGSRSCSAACTMLALVCAVIFGFLLASMFNTPPSTAALSPEETASVPPPTVCPEIVYEVNASADMDTVTVGDTFTVHSRASGFAGLAETRLYVEYRIATVPDFEVRAVVPLVEVLPESTGSSLGIGDFVLRALAPGTVRLHTEVYGDAYFYSGTTCTPGTTFKLVRSAPVSVTIVPMDD